MVGAGTSEIDHLSPASPPRVGAKGRRTKLAIVSVAVALTAVLAYLIGPFGGPFDLFANGQTGQQSETFSQAFAASNSAVASQGGSPWSLVHAFGYLAYQGYTWAAPSGANSSCAAMNWPRTVPMTTSLDAKEGMSPYWTFFYVDSAGSTLETVVLNGGVTVAIDSYPVDCYGPLNVRFPPTMDIVDTTRVTDQLGLPLQDFTSNHSTLSGYFALGFNAANSTSPGPWWMWSVILSPCPLTSTGLAVLPPGPVYEGVVNATSGTILSSQVYGVSSC